MDDLTLETRISYEKDGYYAFEDTVFYGEKGGMLSDEGTINDLNVIDLKWDGDVLLHKVDGILSDPIHMEVDRKTRSLNTSVQSALHLMDGFYERKGLYIPSIGVDPKNQWYEVSSKDISDEDLKEAQEYISDLIRRNVPVKISYQKGSEYPNEKYQKFDELRIVTIGEYDSQPCGTIHVPETSRIGSFVILGKEKSSRGTKVYFACNDVVEGTLKQYGDIVHRLDQTFSCKDEEILSRIEKMNQELKESKKKNAELQKQLTGYQVKEILESSRKEIEADDEGSFRLIAQELMRKPDTEGVWYARIGEEICFSIISSSGKAREIFAEYQEKMSLSGGGSPKMVICKTEEIDAFLESQKNGQ